MYNSDKLEGFTEHAAQVLHLAEIERQLLQDSHVGTEHLLLGLVSESKGLAAKILKEFDIDQRRVRYQLVFMTDRSASHIAHSSGLTPCAKTVLSHAASEARRLNDHSISTGHLLSGLVRAGECTASDILESLGVDIVRVRRRTLQLLCQMERSYTNPQSLAPFPKRETTARLKVSHLRLVPLHEQNLDRGQPGPYAKRVAT